MNYWWINANSNDDDDNSWNWTSSKKIGQMEEWYEKVKPENKRIFFASKRRRSNFRL